MANNENFRKFPSTAYFKMKVHCSQWSTIWGIKWRSAPSYSSESLSLSLSHSLYFSLLPFLLFSHYCLAFSALRSFASLGPSFAQVSHRFRVDSLWTGSLLAPLVLFPSIPAMPFPNDVSNPEVPQAYHLRYRRLVKGFPLSALHHVAFPSTTPPPLLTFLPAPPLSTLLLRLTVFRP